MLTRRPRLESDWEFFRRCHHAAYHDVISRQYGGWDEPRQDGFAASSWSQETHEILLWDGQPAGYTCVEERPDDLHVRELVVHPDFQGRGIGTVVLHDTIARARARGVPVRLGTHLVNRAANLYRRMGFRETGRTNTHILFEWREESSVNEKANGQVKALLEELVTEGREVGLQVAAYLDGKQVLDAWAGQADRHSGRAVDGDSLFTVYSTGKGVVATAIHLLADHGQLDYDAPIASYWPEFAASGKERVTVRDALTHRSGIPQMPTGLVAEDLLDWEKMVAAVAQLTPMFPAGTTTAYHALTFGWILGEVVRRVDGRPIGRFVQEEFCRPLGMSDLYFGIPESAAPRVVRLERGEGGAPEPPPDALYPKAAPPELAGILAAPRGWRAAIPGGNMVASARSLARLYASLIGEVDGVRLLPASRVRTATELQTADVDAALGVPVNKGLGYFMGGLPTSAMGPRISAFGHSGFGGSIAYADPDKGLAVGLAKTLLRTFADPMESTTLLICNRIRETLGVA